MVLEIAFKNKKKYYINIDKFRSDFLIRNIFKINSFIFFIFLSIFIQKKLYSDTNNNEINFDKNKSSSSNIKWENLNIDEKYKKEVIWERIENIEIDLIQKKEVIKDKDLSKDNNYFISSFNRSIVFNNSIVGPDISWLVPPGFKWNKKYKFDASTRGHSRRNKGERFIGWNRGDAVGQFYYQFLNNDKNSFGLNFGIRSIYSGTGLGGSTAIGEGQSIGFRRDYQISSTAGFAFGAEQLLHFDGLTDTGRDIYLTLSKAFWKNNIEGKFPLNSYTLGIATGKMAEGNIKFLCSNLFGGSGTEILHQRSLCWAPVFTISRIHNKRFSTFFEYNSKFFLLGSSIIPFNKIPLRGTFAVQLSDHIDNYKLKDFEEQKWVFRLSFGF